VVVSAAPYSQLVKAVQASNEASLKLTARTFKALVDTGTSSLTACAVADPALHRRTEELFVGD
jgi:hypothetical protein